MSKPLKLPVLVENTARGRGLLAEHGLAFWLETESKRILFDAGQTDILSHITGSPNHRTEFPGRIHAAPVGTRLAES